MKEIKSILNSYNLIFDSTDKRNLNIFIIFMFFGMMLELLSVGLVLPCIKLFTNKPFLNSIYNFFNIEEMSPELLMMSTAIFMLAVFAFKNFFLWIVLRKQAFFLTNYGSKLQLKIFNGYLKKSVLYFKKKNSSDLITDIINITDYYSSIYLSCVILIFLEISMTLGLLAVLLYFSWETTLLIALIFGSATLILFKFNKNTLLNLGHQRNILAERQLQGVQQGIGGIKEIKILGRESFFLDKFKIETNKIANVSFRSTVIAGTPRLIVEFFAVLSLFIIVFYLSLTGKPYLEILPILGIFLAAAYKMVPSFNKILFMANRIKFSAKTAEKIIGLLNEFKESKEEINTNNKIQFTNEINVCDVSYEYPNRKNPVLIGTNLKIKKNSFIGISGASGVGKSTLIDIIMGITKPDKGSILVDDISISDSIKNWQNSIGYVSQNVFLIPSTIRRNIAFGISEDKIDENKISQAINKSALKDFVDNLLDKVDTQIGEGGAMISAGQKQRIGIARALYNEPKLLIFDEATSSLDPKSEEDILNEIELLKKETTLIFISHRATALRNCDDKYFLKNGLLIKA